MYFMVYIERHICIIYNMCARACVIRVYAFHSLEKSICIYIYYIHIWFEEEYGNVICEVLRNSETIRHDILY